MPHSPPSVDTQLLRLLGKQTAIFDELRGLMPEEFVDDLETVEPMGMSWHSAMEAVGEACDAVEDLARMVGADEGPSVESIANAAKSLGASRVRIENVASFRSH